MAIQIQIRRDSAADWTSENPILADGEMGLESDTNKIKFGDGSTAWSSLSYFGVAAQYQEALERESNTVLFDNDYIIGNASARTGNILFDFTGAKLGATTWMTHNDSSAFTFPSEGIKYDFEDSEIQAGEDMLYAFTLTDKSIGSEIVQIRLSIKQSLLP